MIPSVWFITGASGTGKSSRARALAATLDTSRLLVVSTDVIRAQLRAVMHRDTVPELWGESFNLETHTPGDELRPTNDGGSVNISAFLRQCAPILAAVDAAVAYAITEGWDVIVEGVHLIPGRYAIPEAATTRMIWQQAPDATEHARWFAAREHASGGGRPAAHYISNLPRIRVIDQLIGEAWNTFAADVAVSHNTMMDIRIGTTR